MEKTIRDFIGIDAVHVAKIIKDEGNTVTYDTPVKLAGTAELSRETEQNTSTKNYDNKPAIVLNSKGADTVTLTTSVVDHETLALITGQFYDKTSKTLVETGSTDPGYFALIYTYELTDGTVVSAVRYKGSFQIPSETHTTKSTDAESAGQELTFTGIATNATFTELGGKSATALSTEKKIADWNTKVYLPGEVLASTK